MLIQIPTSENVPTSFPCVKNKATHTRVISPSVAWWRNSTLYVGPTQSHSHQHNKNQGTLSPLTDGQPRKNHDNTKRNVKSFYRTVQKEKATWWHADFRIDLPSDKSSLNPGGSSKNVSNDVTRAMFRAPSTGRPVHACNDYRGRRTTPPIKHLMHVSMQLDVACCRSTYYRLLSPRRTGGTSASGR